MDEDELLVQEDFRKLDKDALAAIASTLAKRNAVIGPSYRNGSYNIILTVEFEDGSPSWICRTPRTGGLFVNENETLMKEYLNSTISTMNYVSKHTSIPVPKVYGYSLDCNNAAKTPYIFMQEFHNTVSFGEVCDDWEDEHVENIVKEWASYTMQLATLQFDRIGSFHLDLDDMQEKVSINRVIAPYNTEERLDEIDANHGPYQSTVDYLLSVSDFKKRSTYEKCFADEEPILKDLLYYNVDCGLEAFIPFLLDRKTNNGPFLLSHADFNLQNILVDPSQPGKIVGVIDWDFACTVPVQSFCLFPRSLMFDAGLEEEDELDESAAFSKKWRPIYRQALLEANERLGLGLPVANFESHGVYWRYLVEGLMFQSEAYTGYRVCSDYVYGSKSETFELLPSSTISDWGTGNADRLGLVLDPETKENAQHYLATHASGDIDTASTTGVSVQVKEKTVLRKLGSFIESLKWHIKSKSSQKKASPEESLRERGAGKIKRMMLKFIVC